MIPSIDAQFSMQAGASQGDQNLQGAIINSGIQSPLWTATAKTPAPSLPMPQLPAWALPVGLGILVFGGVIYFLRR